MNAQGLIPLVLGMVLISLGVSGKYKNAWAVISGKPAEATRAA